MISHFDINSKIIKTVPVYILNNTMVTILKWVTIVYKINHNDLKVWKLLQTNEKKPCTTRKLQPEIVLL